MGLEFALTMHRYDREGSPAGRIRLLALLAASVVVASGLAIEIGGSSTAASVPASGRGSAETGSGLVTASTGVLGTILDGGTVSTLLPHPSTLRDTISYGTGIGDVRSYTIQLTASFGLPLDLVTVKTTPLEQWGLPHQMPGGVDNLPPLDLWNWSIVDDGLVVTTLWSLTSWDSVLSGITTWSNQTIVVRGTTDPSVALTVSPSERDGAYAPEVGLVMNTPGSPGIPANDSTFTSTAAALNPAMIRISTAQSLVSYKWNTKAKAPNFNFTYFDQLVAFAKAVGAQVMVSFPAGDWGDGNVLPNGMPVNHTVPVPGPASYGYLAGNGAYAAYVEGVVNHTIAAGESIAYWSIGNEFPTRNLSLVVAYTNLYNIAEEAIHARLPDASVGSDVMTNGTYETYFAHHAKDVGFLSFHYYASATMCVVDDEYCAPQGSPLGSTDVGMFSHTAYQYLVIDNSPPAAQGLWYNLTGKWLPIFNTETNLNPVGGSYAGGQYGSDPRTQTLFGATWLVSLLIDSALANVSQVDYYTFSSGWGLPNTLTTSYGGWGYGLTDELPNGSNVRYAPYFAMQMWTDAIPAGAPGLEAVSSQPDVVHVFAAIDGSDLSVVIENRVNVKVAVSLDVQSSTYHLVSIAKLDQTTYGMVYEPKHQTTVLRKAGVDVVDNPTSATVNINGYGVAVATYSLTAAHSTPAGLEKTTRPVKAPSALRPGSTVPRDVPAELGAVLAGSPSLAGVPLPLPASAGALSGAAVSMIGIADPSRARSG